MASLERYPLFRPPPTHTFGGLPTSSDTLMRLPSELESVKKKKGAAALGLPPMKGEREDMWVVEKADKILLVGVHSGCDFLCEDREGRKWLLPHVWLRGPPMGGKGYCSEIVGPEVRMWDCYQISEAEISKAGGENKIDWTMYPGVMPPSHSSGKPPLEETNPELFAPFPEKFRGRVPTAEETAPIST